MCFLPPIANMMFVSINVLAGKGFFKIFLPLQIHRVV